jgi:hypothetical protein
VARQTRQLKIGSGATRSGAASLELENMLKLKVKIMLKLEITNISANKLKIK